ncbi:magnesium transporter [Phycisphaera mikurensis]|uniref:Magnesium transporter n=1 Tax=Phycisphaera mikurensis (strain NBRC 102666 / KCTC 22515 / FYK2301M01) TaxID=1142394 RepID=I0IGD3_PHYMF|nr:magnesium transporter [Phycisphaera mikurensis]MBB6440301.1 magnesium transporter [Phycisphaera mikurensis]BAM04321.1 magnesium transporter [Phycisphaera mikurensis NBRC 102666]
MTASRDSVTLSADVVPIDRRDLRRMIDEASATELHALVDEAHADEIVHAVTSLPEDEREKLFDVLDAERGAAVLELLPDSQAVDSLESLDPDAAAELIHELDSEDQADLIALLDDPELILSRLPAEEAEEIRDLASYPADTAGGMMGTEFLAFPLGSTVGDVVKELQDHADEHSDADVQYVYVTDEDGRLRGVLPLRNLVVSKRARKISDVMIADPLAMPSDATLDRMIAFFDDHHFLGVPVVTTAEDPVPGRLLGVLQAAEVDEAEAELRGGEFRRSQGIVGGEELRSMPLLLRSRRRFSWLTLNIGLNVVAASVIARNLDVIEAIAPLAVIMPIISDMSGCSGNQAVAVSMRELSLNVARPSDWFRVWRKEAAVGSVNGIGLGLLLGLAGGLWQGPWFGFVVGAALAANTLVAVSIGGVVPLLLKGLKLDPAVGAGPILTTVTDMCGFFLVLTMAANLLQQA